MKVPLFSNQVHYGHWAAHRQAMKRCWMFYNPHTIEALKTYESFALVWLNLSSLSTRQIMLDTSYCYCENTQWNSLARCVILALLFQPVPTVQSAAFIVFKLATQMNLKLYKVLTSGTLKKESGFRVGCNPAVSGMRAVPVNLCLLTLASKASKPSDTVTIRAGFKLPCEGKHCHMIGMNSELAFTDPAGTTDWYQMYHIRIIRVISLYVLALHVFLSFIETSAFDVFASFLRVTCVLVAIELAGTDLPPPLPPRSPNLYCIMT